MRLRIIAAGTRMPSWVEQGYREYARRLGGDCRLELVEIRLGKRTRGTRPDKAKADEGLAMAEFKKASGILGGLWDKVRERPTEFLNTRTIDEEGLDVAARDFLAGMTDRFAIRLFEELFIPKPWVE